MVQRKFKKSGGKARASKEERQKERNKESIKITANLRVKLSNVLHHVSFESVFVFFQHGTQGNRVFCCHQACHVAKRITQLTKGRI